jgi:hypothetical protein
MVPLCFKSNPSSQDQSEHCCGNCEWIDDCLGGRQTRKGSLLETVTSTAIGFAVSLVLTAVVMPAFGYPTTWAHDFWITCIFTVASIARGYCVRRLFNR